ncbi:sulfotransferase family 2 domain-containing protein [Pseudomonadota bacterium]
MLISENPKFIFVHIYKNAGTSITSALLPIAASWWQIQFSSLFRKLNILLPPQPFLKHVSASYIIDAIGVREFESYFSFAFVRNPWDWQVSLYEYMLKTPTHRQHQLIKGFSDFKTYLQWRCEYNVTFQRDFICSPDGRVLVDFVGRFERIEENFQKICTELGICVPLPRENVSRSAPYQNYYDAESIELVKTTFKADIEHFGYQFET